MPLIVGTEYTARRGFRHREAGHQGPSTVPAQSLGWSHLPCCGGAVAAEVDDVNGGAHEDGVPAPDLLCLKAHRTTQP